MNEIMYNVAFNAFGLYRDSNIRRVELMDDIDSPFVYTLEGYTICKENI